MFGFCEVGVYTRLLDEAHEERGGLVEDAKIEGVYMGNDSFHVNSPWRGGRLKCGAAEAERFERSGAKFLVLSALEISNLGLDGLVVVSTGCWPGSVIKILVV